MREKQVRQLAKQKFNYVIGGYANMFEDMEIDTMPILDEIVDEVYEEIMSDPIIHLIDGKTILLQKDIRFLGTDRIKEIIKEVGE